MSYDRKPRAHSLLLVEILKDQQMAVAGHRKYWKPFDVDGLLLCSKHAIDSAQLLL